MQREITYDWSPELARLGARRFIFPILVRQCLFLMIGVLLLAGTNNIMWWIVIVVAIFNIIEHIRSYFRVSKKPESTDIRITIRIEPENITFATSEQTTAMKWSAIKALWTFSDVLLLFTSKSRGYSIIPVAVLGEELKCFIEDRIKENGGKVVSGAIWTFPFRNLRIPD